MKEATGELNVTVIVIVAIGVLMAFFYFTLWPLIKNNFERNSQCSKAICSPCPTNDCKFVTCYPKGKYGNSAESFECVYKG